MKSRPHTALIALVILTAALLLPAQTSAPATTRASSTTFLNLGAAKLAIIDDSLDPYFDKLCPAEMSAKTSEPITGDTREAQIAECKRRCQAACLEFTATEQAEINGAVVTIHKAMQRAYPRFARQPWSFLKIADTLEGGMPHTRGPHIILPHRLVDHLTRTLEQQPGQLAPQLVNILIHEQTHVVQRLHPHPFAKLYADTLGFTRATRIESHPSIEDRRVVNPDGPVCDWVYSLREGETKRWIWPRLVLKENGGASLDIDAIAVDVIETGDNTFKVKLDNGEPVTQPLLEVKPYLAATRAGFNSYHPNEISADLFARLFVFESFSKREPIESLNDFRVWAKESFAPSTATDHP